MKAWFGLSVAVALALSALLLVLSRAFGTETGLTRTFYASPDFDGPAVQAVTDDLTLSFIDEQQDPPRRFSVEWDGRWYLERDGAYEISVDVDDILEMRLDDAVIIQKALDSTDHMISTRVELSRGSHALNVRYEQHGGGYFLAVFVAPVGGAPAPFSRSLLFPRTPSDSNVAANRRLEMFRRVVLAVGLVPVTVLIGWLVPRVFRASGRMLDRIPFPEADA